MTGDATTGQGLRLLVVTRGETLDVVPLASGVVTIGRRQTCSINPQDAMVAASHGSIEVAWDGGAPSLTVQDRGSTNGTFVRGVLIRPGVPTAFEPGEPIVMGRTVLIVMWDRSGTEIVMA
jgi:pSer/pThr/pTyr-binding forkhead associated (FHA) protein